MNDPNDGTLRSLVSSDTIEAIARVERRVRILNTEVNSFEDEGRLEVSITYVILRTQEAGNLVFPFFLDTGPDLLKPIVSGS